MRDLRQAIAKVRPRTHEDKIGSFSRSSPEKVKIICVRQLIHTQNQEKRVVPQTVFLFYYRSMSRQQIKILIIAASATDRKLCQDLLAGDTIVEYSFREAADARAGWEAWRAQTPDCLLLVHDLPHLDGLSFLDTLRHEVSLAGFPVVLLTSQDDPEGNCRALRHGAQECLTLDGLTPEQLQRAVTQARARASWLQETQPAESLLAHYQLLSKSTRDIVFLLSPDGRIVEANQTAVNNYGYDRATLLGLNVFALRAPSSLASCAEDLQQAKETGRLWETIHRRCDGTEFPVEVNSGSVVVKGKRMLLSIVRDITARKQADEALRVQEENFRALVEATSQAVWTVGDAAQDKASRAWWSALTGQTMTESENLGWLDVLHPDDRAQAHQAWAHALATRTVFATEYRVLSQHTGAYLHFAVRGVPMFNPDGSFRQWIGTLTDISERKQAEAALQESEERFRQLADNVTAAFYIDDLQSGRTLYANPAFERLWHIDRRQLYQHGANVWIDMIHPADRPLFDAAFARLVEEGELEEEYRIITPSGDVRWVRDRAFAVKNAAASNYRVAGISEDITERKQAEAERELLLAQESALRAEAETANGLKDEFLATLSHELRSPMTAILGWAKMLRAGHLEQHNVVRAVEVIERNALAQNRLIEDLLDISRIVTGKMFLELKPVAVASVVRAAIEVTRPAAQAKGISVITKFPDVAVMVSGDANRLQQVAWNLLSNAVKFTPAGGQITVAVNHIQGFAEIVVSDWGEGIAPEFLPFVFDRFRQADGRKNRRHGGLGLGLAIVRQMVELHGGTVAVASAGLGQGTTFTVSLPLLIAASTASVVQEPELPPDALQGLRILLVDDEPDARELTGLLVRNHGAEVQTFASALDLLDEFFQRPPDLLISDIGLEGTDGYTLIGHIRNLPAELGGQVPALALNVYASDNDIERDLAAGLQAHLAKPVFAQSLIQTILGLVAGQKP